MTYDFHPAADIFPLMEGEEFAELVADIKANGQREWIKLWGGKILDGRNRYRACKAAGVKPRFEHLPAVDPVKYVISANIHRRHLTAEQKRDLIAKLLKAQPEKSDRQIGKMAQVSKNTAKSVRDEMEARGQIDHVEKRTDTKGREQPAKKQKKRRTPEEIRIENFKHAINITVDALENLSAPELFPIPQQLSTEDADWTIEQIRCGEHALRALANRIKQVRSGPKRGDAHGDEAPYDGADDFAKSIDDSYRAVRERKAAGGPGWEPKP